MRKNAREIYEIKLIEKTRQPDKSLEFKSIQIGFGIYYELPKTCPNLEGESVSLNPPHEKLNEANRWRNTLKLRFF